METEKFKKQTNKARGGKNNTQTILTAGGAMAVGGIVGAVAGNVAHHEDMPDPKPQPNQPENTNASETSENLDNPSQKDTHVGFDTLDTSDTPENPATPNSLNRPQPEKPDSLTPDEIAQAIISNNEIDINDIDVPNVIAVESFTTMFDENGNELSAAMVRTPDGTPYILADLDGDGIYEGVLNTDGYLVAQAEANLTHSDLEALINDGGGYLAINELDNTSTIDDPTGDIIIIDDKPSSNFAQSEDVNDDGTNVDDMIAQLLEGDPDDKYEEDEVIIDDDNEEDDIEEGDDDSEDYGDDDAIDDDGDIA